MEYRIFYRQGRSKDPYFYGLYKVLYTPDESGTPIYFVTATPIMFANTYEELKFKFEAMQDAFNNATIDIETANYLQERD